MKKDLTESNNQNRFAFVIPVYNHAGTVPQVVKDAQALGYPVFVVDDGSTDSTYERIQGIKGIQVLRHEQNQGKGAAILTGFAAAADVADFAITIDADGQHYPEDAINLIKAIPEHTRPIVVGGQACSLDKQFRTEVFQLLGADLRRPRHFRFAKRISYLPAARSASLKNKGASLSV